jgi:DNA-binding response OmpR family regulator
MTAKDHDTRRQNGSAIPTPATVLLVNEDHKALRYYSGVIESFGYQVRSCGSYEEGARLVDADTFQLIIVSQGSPQFEGRSVLERANQVDRSLPVLVLARCLDMQCYLEAMQLGAADYLAEPVSVRELHRAADTHLRLYLFLKGSGNREKLRRGKTTLELRP